MDSQYVHQLCCSLGFLWTLNMFICLNLFQEEKGCWLWKKPPPLSKKPVNMVDPVDGSKIKVVRPKTKKVSFKIKDRLLKGI